VCGLISCCASALIMSIIHPNAIKAIAHSIDIPKLSDEAAKTLAPDVEYRLREVVQVR
jgi:transcription initiation factor TFIID subunit 6